MKERIAWRVKLLLRECGFYRVKKGQTLALIAKTFSCPVPLLVRKNGLTEEVKEGEILLIPERDGHLYAVRGGESKTLLCGSEQAFIKRNGTHALYPTQTVVL